MLSKMMKSPWFAPIMGCFVWFMAGFGFGQSVQDDGIAFIFQTIWWLIFAGVFIAMVMAWRKKKRMEKEAKWNEFQASLNRVSEAARGFLDRMKQSSEKTATGSTPAAPAMVTGMGAIARAATEVSRSSSDSVRVPRYVLPAVYAEAWRNGEVLKYNINHHEWHDDSFDPNVVWGPCFEYDCHAIMSNHRVPYTKEKP